MKLTEYRQNTLRTLPDLGKVITDIADIIPSIGRDDVSFDLVSVSKMIGVKLNLSHMALGLAGEIGELVECVGTELSLKINKVNLGEELGDIYWYLANYANMQDIPLPEELEITKNDEDCLDLLIISISKLVDLVKRQMAYNKPIEKSKELEATYDVCQALFLFEKVYGLSGDEIRAKNIQKLRVRFPDKFSDHLAVNRNLDEERKTLE